jgi:hypothetical protein
MQANKAVEQALTEAVLAMRLRALLLAAATFFCWVWR